MNKGRMRFHVGTKSIRLVASIKTKPMNHNDAVFKKATEKVMWTALPA